MKSDLRLILYFILILSCPLFSYSQILTQVDSIQLPNANIWGVSYDDGDSLGITTTQSTSGIPHIFLRKVDYNNINQQSNLKQLTFNADFNGTTNLTDHKTLIFNNEIYIAFSTVGDQDLFLFKTDINGNRIGNIVTVVSGSTDPTNDMILTTDSTFIYVLHFSHPFHHHVYKFDTNLNPIGSPITTNTIDHNNIGQAIYLNNEFHLFTGGGFGTNSGIIHSTWDNNWGTISSSMILPPSNSDGNWFSTGAVFDEANQRWYIAFSHLESGQQVGQEHIDLAVFDNNFNLLERKHVTSSGYFRPHLTLKNNYLYLSYDASGSGVYLIKHEISSTNGIPQIQNTTLSIYPNPVRDYIHINLEDNTNVTTIEIFDLSGNLQYAKTSISNSLIDVKNLNTGVYFIKINSDNTINHITKFIKL